MSSTQTFKTAEGKTEWLIPIETLKRLYDYSNPKTEVDEAEYTYIAKAFELMAAYGNQYASAKSMVVNEIIVAYEKVLRFGVAKYHERDTWRTKVKNPKQTFHEAYLRHYFNDDFRAHLRDIDEESGFPHLYHAIANLLFLDYLTTTDSETIKELNAATPYPSTTPWHDQDNPYTFPAIWYQIHSDSSK